MKTKIIQIIKKYLYETSCYDDELDNAADEIVKLMEEEKKGENCEECGKFVKSIINNPCICSKECWDRLTIGPEHEGNGR